MPRSRRSLTEPADAPPRRPSRKAARPRRAVRRPAGVRVRGYRPRRAVALAVIVALAICPVAITAVIPGPKHSAASAMRPLVSSITTHVAGVSRPLSAAPDVLPPRLVERSVRPPDSPHVELAGRVVDGGSGVAAVQLLVDGRSVAAKRITCSSTCPRSHRLSLGARLGRQAGVPQALALLARDGAGNRALLWHRISARSPRSDTRRLTAQVGSHRLRFTRDGRRQYDISGHLTRSGLPVPHARIEVVALTRTAAAVPHSVGRTRTDAEGGWQVRDLPSERGSRIYLARHLDRDGTTLTSSVPAQTTVRTPISVQVRSLTGRRRLITGRIPSSSGHGVRVLAARRVSSGWEAIRTALTSRLTGRFEIPISADQSSALAVFVPPSPDWPYAPAGRVLRNPALHP
jgi:hypothetical protein